MNSIERLHATLAAVCPILGVSVPSVGSSVGVVVSYDPAATAPQISAAQSALAAFNWSQSSQNTFQTQQDRTAAKAAFASSTDSLYKLLRCQSDIIRQQLNTLGDVIGTASVVWDPPNVANGAGATSPSLTVTGAAFGDFVDVGVPVNLAALVCTGYVSAANTVNIRIHNGTGSAVNLASGTWRVVVRRQPGTRTLLQLRNAIEALIDGGTLD